MFVGLSMEAPIWDVTVFTKDHECLLEAARRQVPGRLLGQPRVKAPPSDKHFSCWKNADYHQVGS
jgi:hypothetical protein